MTIEGNAAANTLTGNSGNNTIYGGGGADTIEAGAGDDHIYLTSTPTLVDGGAGVDSIFVQSGAAVFNDKNILNVEKFFVLNGGSINFSYG